MDIRYYTAKVLPQLDGVIELDSAPSYNGSALPESGMLGYHEASALSLAARELVMKAMKEKNIFVTFEITVSGLNSETRDGRKINIASLKPDEVQYCDIMHLGRISAPLRQNLVDFFRSIAKTAEQKVKLSNITNDTTFTDYIKMYPSVVDALHEHDVYKHMKVIIFPTGGEGETKFMVSMKGIEPDNVSIKPIGPVKDAQFKLADKFYINPVSPNPSLDNSHRMRSISP